MDYLKELNENQSEAVTAYKGPVMVVAGAGSGKTRVLTYRIAYIIEQGIDPFNIMALTFTNKAAREMKERIASILKNGEVKNLWMGTFHSVFSRILRLECDKIGYPKNFTIYDSEDSKSVIKSILKENNFDDKIYKPSIVLKRISTAKTNLVTYLAYSKDSEISAQDDASRMPYLGFIYEKYVKKCFKSGAMDFDDLLFNTYFLFRKFPDVLEKYQNQFKYLLVDEFQDTNHLQYEIIKALAQPENNICVVGDDAQSIYAFRGANIQNILNFKKQYPKLKTFKLEQNYRSTQNIVNAANSVIKKNKNQLEKVVWTDNDEGEKIKVIKNLSDNEEGYMVANSIFEIKMQNQCINKDFAVLYRTNAQSRALEEALRKMNIPYRIYGGQSFYKRKEILDILAYFRLVVNNKDEEALKRIINYPVRGIGKTTLDKLIWTASNSNATVWDVLEDPSKHNVDLNSGTINKLSSFVAMIKSFKADLKTKNAYDLAYRIASESKLSIELYSDKTPEGVGRYENVQELLNAIKDFSEGEDLPSEISVQANPERSLESFMESVALLTSEDEKDKENDDKVSLMTIHQAKGLEFPFVYIVGLEEDLFPNQMSLSSRVDLEEERRLFYVALTRAEKQAILSFAVTRYKYGNLNISEPSRFIEEIDASFLDYKEARDQRERRVDSFYSDEIYDEKPKFSSKPIFTKKAEIDKVVSTYSQSKRQNLVNLKEAANKVAVDNNDYGDLGSKIKVGLFVEHLRFGQGEVIDLEGEGNNRKATVKFRTVGVKQLLLKFAKLKMV